MQFSKNSVFIYFVVFIIISLGLWYKLFSDIKHQRDILDKRFTQDFMSSDQIQSDSNESKKENQDIFARPIKKQIWTAFQHELRDTVVQVFAQVTQFNWVKPFETPNQSEVTGTAFFINGDGELVTNAHVVNEARVIYIQIPSCGKKRFEVEVQGVSPERDLALLKVKSRDCEAIKSELKKDTIPSLELGDSDLIERADKIIALGYPLGQQGLKGTTGIVSGREHIDGQYFIQISAPLNQGNSGGPSIDRNGKVVGVNAAIIRNAQNVGYIIPINEVKLFLNQLRTMPGEGKPKLLRKPFLGVFFNNANENLTAFLGNPPPGGLFIVDVLKGSPLYKAGLQAGDMIYKINGIDVDVYGEMQVPWSKEERVSITDYISRLEIGQKITIEYYRKGKKNTASFVFTLANRPPISLMYPGYEKIDYEVIGGLVVMPLTVNHIVLLGQYVRELILYTDVKRHVEPALIITHVLLNSPASEARTIGAGSIISEVNGEKVKTLDEFRSILKKSLDSGYLTIKTTENIFVVIPIKEIIDKEVILSSTYFYPISQTFKELERSYLQKNKGSK